MFTDERFLGYVGINHKKKKSIVGVRENVLDKLFWHRVDEVCKIIEPLVKVLKVVDQDKKPTMPYIYEAMDRAKRSIETIRNHKTYIKMIDSRWNRQLHNNLHAAGNVQLFIVVCCRLVGSLKFIFVCQVSTNFKLFGNILLESTVPVD